MKRSMTVALLVASLTVPKASGAFARNHTSAPTLKQVCHIKKVHGKKTKVCKTVKAKPTPTPTPTLSAAEQVDHALTAGNFSGSILLEKGGQMLLEKSYGMADRASNTPNSLQTKIPIFGINFQMTAVGIMKLQEEGKLAVGDKLCSYITACPTAWQPITLEELLTTTSGIPDYDWTAPVGRPETTMAGCQVQPLVETPGQRIVTTDCSSFLLNTVIEKVSGKSWSEFMQQAIFGPAGMTNSGRMTNSFLTPQRARGYSSNGPAPELNYNAYYMAYSTIEDVYRFDSALLAGKILSPSSLGALFAPRMEDPPPDLNGNPFFRAYGGTDVSKASNTTVSQVAAAGGSEAWGFVVTEFFSPDNGTIAIALGNGTGSFTNNDDNRFWDLLVRPAMFGK